MPRRQRLSILFTLVLAVSVGGFPLHLGQAPLWAQQIAPSQPLRMEWLSWSHFRFTSPTGKVVLTNPYVANPDSRVKVEDINRADIILVADGHRDEIGSTPEIAKKTGAQVVAVRELAVGYLAAQKIPQQQLVLAGIGDSYTIAGIKVRVVHSIHGSGVPDPTAPYGGPAAGFIVTFENGVTVYFAGSTAIHTDMQLYGSLYKPHVAILPLSGNRDPLDVAHMVRLLLTDNPNLKTVIPHHHRLQPPRGAPTPAALAAEINKMGLPVAVLDPKLGESYTLSP